MLVLFDLDDTLVDHATAFQAGTQALYKSLDSPVPFEQFAQAWTSSHRRQYNRYLAGELSYGGQRVARVREVIDPTLSDQEAESVFAAYLDAYEAGWSLFPDVLACLDGLSDCQLGIVTNGQGHQQRSKLERTGISDRFDCVVISEEHGKPKPHAEIFWHACSSVGEEPGRSVFVGDIYELDALAARRAGLVGVWLNRAVSVGAEHAPPIIHSLSELGPLVRAVQQTGWALSQKGLLHE